MRRHHKRHKRRHYKYHHKRKHYKFQLHHKPTLDDRLRRWWYYNKRKIKALLIILLIILGGYYLNKNKGKVNPYIQKLKLGLINLYEKVDREIKNILHIEPERKEECMEAFDYLNKLRVQYGKSSIKWDDRLYNLAIFRCKDMYERDYFDHVTPEGTCAKDFKFQFGIDSNEFPAENCGGMSYYSKGSVAGNCKEAVNVWMTSRGHKYNLLYDEHVSGAIGCYYEICIFYGLHNNPYGLGAGPCTTGAQGLAFWETLPKQVGEI